VSRGLVGRVLRAYAKALLPAAGAAAAAWPLATALRGGGTHDIVTLLLTGVVGAIAAGLVLLVFSKWFPAEMATLRRMRPGRPDRPAAGRGRRSEQAAGTAGELSVPGAEPL
jgi:hypothetical protein